MTCEVHCTTLIWLLQQLASMERAFRDEGIVVLLAKMSCRMQATRNDAYSLELRSRIADRFFVYCEGLGKKLVCNFLKIALVSNLTTGDEETKSEVCRASNTSVKCGERVVHEFVESRRLRLPIILKMLALLVLSCEFETGCDNGGRGVFDPFVAF